ncbi:MAG: PhzF family phenazine biosynthesis protein [Patescibacteria group bacterium]
MISAQLLRIFTDKADNLGDLASVVIDEGKRISDADRQVVAKKINTGETIFVNDIETAKISVIHPQGEIDFAGVGVLGASWFLTKLRGKPTNALLGRAGEIKTWQEGKIVWVRANASTMPPWHHKQLDSAELIERITLQETAKMDHTMVWAWIDESKGVIRSRTFAKDWDIPEAEGNGSGSIMLANILKRDIEVRHGKGSVIFAKPAPNNFADLGGLVIEDSITSINIEDII